MILNLIKKFRKIKSFKSSPSIIKIRTNKVTNIGIHIIINTMTMKLRTMNTNMTMTAKT